MPMYGDGFRVGFTGLGRGGEAPGGRDASEEDWEEVKGKRLAASELLLGAGGGVVTLEPSGIAGVDING
jgi:hypothetical protein